MQYTIQYTNMLRRCVHGEYKSRTFQIYLGAFNVLLVYDETNSDINFENLKYRKKQISRTNNFPRSNIVTCNMLPTSMNHG